MADALRPPPAWFRAARAVVRRLPAGRFRAFERLSRVDLPPFEDRLADEVGGARYGCDLRNVIAREACLTGRTAPAETAALRASLPSGGTFVDVGANWGYFTLVAAHAVGSAGRVVALEPDPRVHAELAANLARNGIRNVAALAVAASDRAGEATLSGYAEADRNRGVSSLVAAPVGDAPSFAVRTTPLDDLLDEHGIDAVDLVKIDVEGAEELVVRGMARGLAEGRYRRVLVELHPGQHPDPARLGAMMYGTMNGAGYRGGWIDTGPEAEREALYGRAASVPRLRPIRGDEPLGPWPHQLWTLPGMEIA
ncbi:MAG TPA: FkbM family methyltransferase [Longimicrobium sp.]|nr:FkbM family methyltransferase [Longimicrobium sp.]